MDNYHTASSANNNGINLLIHGYLRQIGIGIPVEIFETIKLWQSKQPNLIIDFITNFPSFTLEIYLDSFAHKLLKIHSYKINYGKTDTSDAVIDNNNKKTLTINKSNIYNKQQHCIAFVKSEWPNNMVNSQPQPILFECTGIDKNGEELIKSKPITGTPGYGRHHHFGGIGPKMNVYNFDVFNNKIKQFITMNEFISSLRKLNICCNHKDELLIQRIFYYINFASKRHENSELKIFKRELIKFIEAKSCKNKEYQSFKTKIKCNKKCTTVTNRWSHLKTLKTNN